MARTLMLQGFKLRPIVFILDTDEESIDPVNLGEHELKPADLGTFMEGEWALMWASLKNQFEMEQAKDAHVAEATANDELTKARVARQAARPARAAARKATAKKAPAKRAAKK